MSGLNEFEDFDKLHVVRQLRSIIGKWWGIQLNFTDAKGRLIGVPKGKFFNPINPLCRAITKNDRTFKDCRETAKKTTQDASQIKGFSLSTCHAGFSTLSLPILIEGTYIGCVFADGFIIEETAQTQKKKISNYLFAKLTDQALKLESEIKNLPVLTKKDLDYLREFLQIIIEEVISLRQTLKEKELVIQSLQEGLNFASGDIIGHSKEIKDILSFVEKIAPSHASVLITGENGTGKEVFARTIHLNSKRKNKAFIIQNCAALNDNLLESELFGHVKGAFTGAIRDKKGLFELADGGTLFLDEIGDTTPSMQVKLLRIIQEGTFIPVGGSSEKKVNVRLITATNKNLQDLISKNLFREDLYYRLNVLHLHIPTLRERKTDIPALAQHFLELFNNSYGKKVDQFSPNCLTLLENYPWPGNIRELKNEIERLIILSDEGSKIIESTQLSPHIKILVRNKKITPKKNIIKKTNTKKKRPSQEKIAS